MITNITKIDGQYVFSVGKCRYRCPDFKSLNEIRTELLKQQRVR